MIMKFSIFPAILAVAMSAALSYLAYTLNDQYDYCWVITAGSFIGFVSTLIPSMAISTPNGRAATNIKTLSGLMFAVMMLIASLFTLFGVNVPFYIIAISLVIIGNLYYIWKIVKADID